MRPWRLLLAALLVDTAAGGMRSLPPSVVSSPSGHVRYFAFGSNLDEAKMSSRGPNGTAIEYSRRYRCQAEGHRLAFNMRGFPPLEPAMASIERREGESCPGCVYECPRESYELLWRSEGGAMETSPYEEIVVPITDDAGRVSDAITLTTRPWARLPRDAPPSERYVKIIEAGARQLGFHVHADRLSRMPRVRPSRFIKPFANFHGQVQLVLYFLGPRAAALRALMRPLRTLVFCLLYGGNSTFVRALSETAIALFLAPTAALGCCLALSRRALGLRPIAFGPPS